MEQGKHKRHFFTGVVIFTSFWFLFRLYTIEPVPTWKYIAVIVIQIISVGSTLLWHAQPQRLGYLPGVFLVLVMISRWLVGRTQALWLDMFLLLFLIWSIWASAVNRSIIQLKREKSSMGNQRAIATPEDLIQER
jgi:hypothetical protein